MADPKELAGRKAVEFIEDGMVVGLGSGTTAACGIRALGERVAGGLRVVGVPTSDAAALLARTCGIPLATLEDKPDIDLTFDGADEVDPQLNLIKGMGGALLREKLVASATARQIILVDPRKMVERLGTRVPVPVEVVPFGWPLVQRTLTNNGLDAGLRLEGGRPFVTDNHNYIIHCRFAAGTADPKATEAWLNGIPGVVENGLFVDLTDVVIVGQPDGGCRIITKGQSCTASCPTTGVLDGCR
jgi:ribose 5-phosphate isomerase A